MSRGLSTKEIINNKLNDIYLKQDIIALLKKIVFITIVIAGLLYFVCGFYIVIGNYMEPAIYNGDLILFYKLDKNFSIGDVIFFNKDNQKIISRIIAKQNDTIDINDEGKILVNGNEIEEENIYFKTFKGDKISFPITLQEYEYFVLGDKRDISKDSRYFGVLNFKDIYGKVIFVFRNRNI